jgi:hypothetical protein
MFLCLDDAYVQVYTDLSGAEGSFPLSFNLDSQNKFLRIII